MAQNGTVAKALTLNSILGTMPYQGTAALQYLPRKPEDLTVERILDAMIENLKTIRETLEIHNQEDNYRIDKIRELEGEINGVAKFLKRLNKLASEV